MIFFQLGPIYAESFGPDVYAIFIADPRFKLIKDFFIIKILSLLLVITFLFVLNIIA
jgi:hypothetical protein